ncbi:Dinitrogenase iron-molybdenum cofactor biosynthesis protein [Ferrimonas balearica DSM 9799]|uniref:Dinitrogenase iron-molybdenum cofactor biosynthesis protein n=1 Tax=Ferrimonas balearica (strain DSM 9799 / CCM 4581 / KCTC 23876 / PAT) TaxID=550540 RepID=E1SUK9_FERBD|nr:NifB/NifX family molybdenum-iron cluster-binding protein [Ferrimonas balearica]ADN77316.1 Dinitrogenase iron-molybdenum cofactor biosynthesis protein [Ferrimonas balearica DSM 9799]MBW3164719.1 dinitrogenase iron-molybdenum cofactor biosynthesis protein [Ferrimonas balearica]
MIAIPVGRERLAPHFTRCQQLAFVDASGAVSQLANPALEGGCAAKKAMLNLIKNQGATAVVVDQIGERLFGKLKAAGIEVLQAPRGSAPEAVVALWQEGALKAMAAEAVNPSRQHAKKGGCGGGCGSGGGCGCGGHDHKPAAKPLAPASPAASGFTITALKRD